MKTRIRCLCIIAASLALLVALFLSGTLPVRAQGLEPPGFDPQESHCPPENPWQKSSQQFRVDSEGYRRDKETTGIIPQATGGPDDFGYTWDDSPTLAWIDASSGADTGMSGDSWDQAVGPISLPFSFKYYENIYSEIYIAAAGYLAFTEADYWDDQEPIPYVSAPNNVVAPYWTPIYIGSAGWVRYLSGGTTPNRYFVVEWHDVKGGAPDDSIGGDETYRFEAILYENGDIVFQYQTMAFNGNWWCGDIGIEDSQGLDGLGYVDFCEQAPSNKTVRFDRPAPSARVSIRPLYQGRFTHAGEMVSFQVPIRNTGDLENDTYDLFVSSSWSAGLYAIDGITPLTDTDADGTVDTGSLVQGGNTIIVVKVITPSTANVGDGNSAAITVRSSLDTAKSKIPNLRTAVPASFAQVYRDDANGAMSLYLVQPGGQSIKKAAPDGYYGYYMAVAEMPSSFIYLWTRYRREGSVYVREIEYTLLDRYGNTVRAVGRLTDHTGAATYVYDYDPTVAVAPNGRIGVTWYRYLWNPADSTWNYNIYYTILDAAGNVVVPPINITNNPVWGYG